MKNTHKIILALVIVLIGIRAVLPVIVKNQINKQLANLPEYQGWVEDVDLVLYKGAVAFDGWKLDKLDEQDTLPFVHIDRVEFGVDLRALFKGSIAADVVFKNPVVNFVASEDTAKQQYGGDYLWFEKLAEMRPMEINRLTIQNGQIRFKKFDSEPQIDLRMTDIQLEARNLRNVVDPDKPLPSSVFVSARMLDSGYFETAVQMNILKEVPDLSLNLKLEDVEVKSLNEFLLTYAKMDATSGELNFYSEVAVQDKEIEGYLKPLITDLKVSNWKEEDRKPGKIVLESLTDVVVELFENQRRDQLASKIPIKGNVENSKVGYLGTLKNVFVNAFIKAFEREVDGTITFPVKAS